MQFVKKNFLFFLLNILTSKIAGYVIVHQSWKAVIILDAFLLYCLWFYPLHMYPLSIIS